MEGECGDVDERRTKTSRERDGEIVWMEIGVDGEQGEKS